MGEEETTGSDSRLSPFFTPLRYREFVFPSRVLLAPINTGFARNGRPSARLLRFHTERAGQAVGANFVGNVATDDRWRTNPGTLVLAETRDVPRYELLARRIRERGSLAAIQLAHSLPELSPTPGWRSADRYAEIDRLAGIVLSLTTAQLRGSLEQFENSARLAAEAGFAIVQVHAAHGYLLSLLLHPATNRRTDRFALHGEWLESLVDALRSAVGGRILSFRISGETGAAAHEEDTEIAIALARRLLAAGVDLLDLSAGFYTLDRRMIYPNVPAPVLPNRPLAERIAALTDRPVSFAGNLLDLRPVAPLPPNVMVSIARALIADPGFAEKSKQARFDRIVPCARHNHCHYFSRGRAYLECGANPSI